MLLFTVSQQSQKEKEFVQTHLVPLAKHVEDFRDLHHRLPTDAEFQDWAAKNYENKAVWYYSEKPGFMWHWGTPGKDFVVGAWRGEWVEYYRSWDKKNFEGDVH